MSVRQEKSRVTHALVTRLCCGCCHHPCLSVADMSAHMHLQSVPRRQGERLLLPSLLCCCILFLSASRMLLLVPGTLISLFFEHDCCTRRLHAPCPRPLDSLAFSPCFFPCFFNCAIGTFSLLACVFSCDEVIRRRNLPPDADNWQRSFFTALSSAEGPLRKTLSVLSIV